MFAFVSIPDPTGGANPTRLRGFNISPSGNWILFTERDPVVDRALTLLHPAPCIIGERA